MLHHPCFFLIVDAIPYAVAREVWESGAFPGFPPPSRMVSTFPSLTNTAIPALVRGLRPVLPNGYEPVWFDPEQGALRHDPQDQTPGRVDTWPPLALWSEAVLYALPQGFTHGQVRWFARRRISGAEPFDAERPWIGWISGTDGLGHFKGRKAQREALLRVANSVRRAVEDFEQHHGLKPRVVLASDHGIDGPLEGRLLPHELLKMLALSGFEPDWNGPRPAVVAAFGAVGSGVVHTRPEHAELVARLVAQVRGVDLAAARCLDGVRVFATREGGLSQALLRRRGDEFLYEPLEGDPLGYAELAGTWRDDAHWFRLTAGLHYPDAIRRLHDALHSIVRHPATVLFSMEPGTSFGARAIHAASDLIGGLVATHGALYDEQSLGFALDSDGSLPPYVRPWEVSECIAGLLEPGGFAWERGA